MKRTRLTTYLGLLLIPLLVLGGFLGTGLASNAAIKQIQAAVVNNDEAVTIDGQIIPLGRQLTAELVDSERKQNFDWVVASEEKARQGLLDGTYAAVVTIPEGFSATATKLKDANEAKQATIEVRTSEVTGIADAAIGQSVANAAVRAFNSMLTEKYLDQIYIGFNKMGDQFVTLKDGTAQLADGAGKLSDGLGEAAPGADKLADGLGQLADGSPKLRDGSEQIGVGLKKLSSGLGQLSDNSAQLRDGSQKAADGLAAVNNQLPAMAAGSQQLAAGSSQLKTGIEQYAGGVMALADKAPALAAGVDKYVAGVGQYIDGVNQFTAGTEAYVGGVRQLLDGLSGFFGGLPDLMNGFTSMGTGLSQWSAGATEWAKGVDALAAGADGLATGAGQAATGVNQAAQGLTELETGAKGVADGAAQLKSGISAFNQQMSSLSIPCPQEFQNANKCDAFAAGVAAAAAAAKSGSDPLVAASGQVSTGATQVAAGVAEAKNGVTAAGAGLGGLATGMKQWSTGVQAAKAGATQLATSAGNIKAGMDQMTTQLAPLIAQAPTIAQNVEQLKAGGTQLTNGIPAIKGAGDALRHAGSHDCVGQDCGIVQAVQMFTGGVSQIDGAEHANSLGLIQGAAGLADGAKQLNDGIQQLAGQFGPAAAGMQQLAAGIQQYTNGVDQAAIGASEAAGRIDEFVQGVRKYTGGVDQAAPGARKLADGISKAATGSSELADGTKKLADGVAEGASEIPSYNSTERENLAKVVSAPVDSSGFDALFLPNIAWTTLVAALALWLAALATYVMVPTIRRSSALSTASSPAVHGEALLPGLVVGAIAALAGTASLTLLLDLSAGKAFGIAGLLLLGAAAFTAVNHALVGMFGGAGRVVSVAFVVITFGAAMTHNATLATVAQFSPLTPVVTGIRSIIIGGQSTVVSALMLVGWLIVGMLLGGFAVARSRTIKAASLG